MTTQPEVKEKEMTVVEALQYAMQKLVELELRIRLLESLNPRLLIPEPENE